MAKELEYKLSESFGFILNQTAREINSIFMAKLDELNIKSADWVVLATLYNKEAIKPFEIAKFIRVEPAVATRILARLEEDGLIIRTLAPNDRRSFNFELSSAGRELTEQLLKISQETNQNFLRNLTDEEIEQILFLLKKILAIQKPNSGENNDADST